MKDTEKKGGNVEEQRGWGKEDRTERGRKRKLRIEEKGELEGCVESTGQRINGNKAVKSERRPTSPSGSS